MKISIKDKPILAQAFGESLTYFILKVHLQPKGEWRKTMESDDRALVEKVVHNLSRNTKARPTDKQLKRIEFLHSETMRKLGIMLDKEEKVPFIMPPTKNKNKNRNGKLYRKQLKAYNEAFKKSKSGK